MKPDAVRKVVSAKCKVVRSVADRLRQIRKERDRLAESINEIESDLTCADLACERILAFEQSAEVMLTGKLEQPDIGIDPQGLPGELRSFDMPFFSVPQIPVVSGIYFLCLNSVVVYVGQSVNVVSRVMDHNRTRNANGEAPGFTTAFYIPVPTTLLNSTEAWFIAKLKPRLNGTSPTPPTKLPDLPVFQLYNVQQIADG